MTTKLPTKSTSTNQPTKQPTNKEATVPTTTGKPKKKTSEPQFDLSNHPLAAFVPGQSYLDSYVGREFDGISDMAVLAACHAMRHNVLLEGPTGSAKTSFVYAYAASIGMPVVNVACNGGIDVRQLIGGWQPLPDGTFHFVPGDLVLGVQHGAIILLNEVNFMPPKIAAVIYGLLDRRRTIYLPDAAGSSFPTQIKAHPSTLVCADYNPGYTGTKALNKAFKNRFAFKLIWDYDHAVEEQLMNSAVLLEIVEDLRRRVEAGDLTTPVSTNLALELEDLAYDDRVGLDFAIRNFVSAFEPDERPSVTEVFTINKDRLYADLFGEEGE